MIRLLLDPAGTDGNGNTNDAELTRLRTENADLRKRLPAEGAIVLSGDQRQAWDAYQALGSVSDVRSNLEAGRKAQGEVSTFKRGEHLSAVAKAAGYDDDVFKGIAGDREYQIAEVDGNRVAQVKEGGQWKPLDEFAKATWAKFMPSLVPATQRATTTTRVAPTRPGLTQANGEPKTLKLNTSI